MPYADDSCAQNLVSYKAVVGAKLNQNWIPIHFPKKSDEMQELQINEFKWAR